MATSDRYTVGKIRVDLRRMMRKMNDSHGMDRTADRRLAELEAARSLVRELEAMINQTIVLARRQDPILPWQEVGDALGISGQAAGQRARTHHLAVDAVTPDDYQRIVTEAAQLCANDPDRRVQTTSDNRAGDFEHRQLDDRPLPPPRR
jgi:hypothetical protein